MAREKERARCHSSTALFMEKELKQAHSSFAGEITEPVEIWICENRMYIQAET